MPPTEKGKRSSTSLSLKTKKRRNWNDLFGVVSTNDLKNGPAAGEEYYIQKQSNICFNQCSKNVNDNYQCKATVNTLNQNITQLNKGKNSNAASRKEWFAQARKRKVNWKEERAKELNDASMKLFNRGLADKLPGACVPWRTWYEWLEVYRDICSTDVQRWKSAVKYMLTWSAIGTGMPLLVSATLTVTEARIALHQYTRALLLLGASGTEEEYTVLQDQVNDTITSFVNLLLKPVESDLLVRGNEIPLQKFAELVGVPSELMDLRNQMLHNSAQDNELLSEYKVAVVNQMWHFLKVQYWDREYTEVLEYDRQILIGQSSKLSAMEKLKRKLHAMQDCITRQEGQLDCSILDQTLAQNYADATSEELEILQLATENAMSTIKHEMESMRNLTRKRKDPVEKKKKRKGKRSLTKEEFVEFKRISAVKYEEDRNVAGMIVSELFFCESLQRLLLPYFHQCKDKEEIGMELLSKLPSAIKDYLIWFLNAYSTTNNMERKQPLLKLSDGSCSQFSCLLAEHFINVLLDHIEARERAALPWLHIVLYICTSNNTTAAPIKYKSNVRSYSGFACKFDTVLSRMHRTREPSLCKLARKLTPREYCYPKLAAPIKPSLLDYSSLLEEFGKLPTNLEHHSIEEMVQLQLSKSVLLSKAAMRKGYGVYNPDNMSPNEEDPSGSRGVASYERLLGTSAFSVSLLLPDVSDEE